LRAGRNDGLAMNLQKELCHKSEEIDDAVLLDVVKALRRRVRRVSHDYDFDRHLPRTIRWLLKTVRVEPFLLTHEIVEKALLDELRFTTFMPIRSRRGPNATRSKRQASRGGRTSPS
jgi:hypothetical protein